MMVALMSGEHRLPACSSRQFAANNSSSRDVNSILVHSASCRTLQAGSLRSPESKPRYGGSRRDPSAQVQDCHAYGQSVGDLIENDTLQAVCDFAVDLDAAVNRARMHDETIRFQEF